MLPSFVSLRRYSPFKKRKRRRVDKENIINPPSGNVETALQSPGMESSSSGSEEESQVLLSPNLSQREEDPISQLTDVDMDRDAETNPNWAPLHGTGPSEREQSLRLFRRQLFSELESDHTP